MSWIENDFEKKIKEKLYTQFDEIKGDEYYVRYKEVRNKLIKDIYPENAAAAPNLSRHDPSHIADVMNSIHRVIGDKYGYLTGMDLYFLGLIVLFHDSGIIKGRKEHHVRSRIKHIYDSMQTEDRARYKQERRLVLRAASAHSSSGKEGRDADTMQPLPVNDGIDGNDVKVREMAVLLRFADELSEGPHRTSLYKLNNGLYDEESKIYHQYASITHVHIDRGSNSIKLTYNIDFKDNNSLRELLEFTYERIHKLDQERKFARHYSTICDVFKETKVVINIEHGEGELTIDNCTLTDLVIPGDSHKPLQELFRDYDIDQIIAKINSEQRSLENA
ncbi:hypothetical protein P1X15_25230 [Runella sp. MFBS21]|uniref:HD domain-containing protein n=1 Tax=Runella sp. MFBS21 TaxID=3034018 RepID=UPI0023FA14BF|nr:hypothetical protein [Runella sp. MFBS21]MDF7820951.1 hypothetical protein [Runella sp. MFBS21]